MPRPRGISVMTSAFVDAYYRANKVTRRSHYDKVLFVNRAPVNWINKTQKKYKKCIIIRVYSFETVY